MLVLVASAALSACGSNGHAGTNDAGTAEAVPLPASSAGAYAIQSRFAEVVKAVSPTVVQIQTPEGLGSGVVYDEHGDIVTNAHVVGTSATFTVTLANGKHGSATLVGSFPANDLAVIHSGMSELRPASFGDSAKLAVGDLVLAVGNPLGLRSSVTDGIVSSLGRTVSEGNGVTLPTVIQTSAPINPGNSGGALVDLAGQVIGIPTLAAADPQLGGGSAPGIGFAISSNTVNQIAPQLIARGEVVNSGRAYLGVEATTIRGGEGVYVTSVVPGSAAAAAGIAPNDVITAVDGQPTRTTEELAGVLAGLKPGQRVSVRIVQPDGSRREVQVTLGQLPGNSS